MIILISKHLLNKDECVHALHIFDHCIENGCIILYFGNIKVSKMITNAILNARYCKQEESMGVAYFLGKIQQQKYSDFINFAMRNPERKHTFVLFEYVRSPEQDTILQTERIPGTKYSIHDILKMPEVIYRINELLVVGQNMRWYTRRKMDFANPYNIVTHVRQVVMKIDAFAFNNHFNSIFGGVKRSREEASEYSDDTYDDMPSLIPI